jgi:DNA-binding NtrC family response regulator
MSIRTQAFHLLVKTASEAEEQWMYKTEFVLLLHAHQSVILLAEDEPLLRNVARIVLEREGYFILSAADGEEAWCLSHIFPAKIDLLLSDVTMRWMDGLQLREKVLEERPETKVLLMSAQADVPVGQSFLRKPFGLYALKERVREMLLPSGRKHRRDAREAFWLGHRPVSNDNAVSH